MSNKKDQLRKWAQLSGLGFQMGATIFICAWGGRQLDAYFNTDKNWFTIGLVLFGVFGSIYILTKQLDSINKNDNE